VLASPDPGPDAQPETIMTGVVELNGVLTAVGYGIGGRDDHTFTWASTDAGATWQLRDSGCCGFPIQLLAAADRFIVVSDHSGSCPCGTAVRTSVDGVNWTTAAILAIPRDERVHGAIVSAAHRFMLWTGGPIPADSLDGPSHLYIAPPSFP
jgi:hypothetical protein